MKKPFRLTAQMCSPDPLTAALAYARAGLKVYAAWGIDETGACACGRKSCKNPGKHPLGEFFPHGHLSATTDRAQLKATWRKYPNANVAIVPDDGLIALDVDSAEAKSTLDALDLPATIVVRSGRGWHRYYEVPAGQKFTPPPGVEIKQGGTGGITVPPSLHHSGRRYRWSGNAQVVATLPTEQLDRRKSIKINFSKSRPTVAAGKRNQRLTSVGGVLRYAGLDEATIEDALSAINANLCDPPLEAEEISSIARSIALAATQRRSRKPLEQCRTS